MAQKTKQGQIGKNTESKYINTDAEATRNWQQQQPSTEKTAKEVIKAPLEASRPGEIRF